MVSSSARLTLRGISYTPLITLLTVSSRVAFIFCLVFPTNLQGRKPLRRPFVSCLKKHPLPWSQWFHSGNAQRVNLASSAGLSMNSVLDSRGGFRCFFSQLAFNPPSPEIAYSARIEKAPRR